MAGTDLYRKADYAGRAGRSTTGLTVQAPMGADNNLGVGAANEIDLWGG